MKETIFKYFIIALLLMPMVLMFHENIYVQLLGGLYVFILAMIQRRKAIK